MSLRHVDPWTQATTAGLDQEREMRPAHRLCFAPVTDAGEILSPPAIIAGEVRVTPEASNASTAAVPAAARREVIERYFVRHKEDAQVRQI
jgi:hypothetical protein